ncbi:MAG: hypothetical protein JWO92_381 [Chitinophagaceae bacterium]|nr:hypothetical protein [Chitinophagaceae bacterium]MDB5222325.1 hypothetical protein [Chitinophagaceae bacterium]
MRLKNIFHAAIIFLLATIIWGCGNSRHVKNDSSPDSVTVRNMVESQNFVFIPRYVNPMTGRRRDLSSGFQISISKDTIISYLPFFGRGYTAPISPADVDFDFTSTKFKYTITPAKRGWNISIKPTDQRYLQELYFRIFDNASASLTITSIDRSSISYDGYITRREGYMKQKK